MHKWYRQMLEDGAEIEDLVHAGFLKTTYSPANPLELLPDIGECDLLIGMSGAFAPLHEGHIYAIETAKSIFVKYGHTNIKVILFPSHDSWVSAKKEGTAKFPIDLRVRDIQSKVNYIIDPVPATLWQEEVDFTYLIERMEALCKNTAFVFGDDNKGFTKVLKYSNTEGVLIPRTEMSSSRKRQEPLYVVRDDSMYSGGNPDTAKRVADAITRVTGIEAYIISAREQIDYVENKLSGEFIVSMDKWFKGDLNIRVSRIFDPRDFSRPIDFDIRFPRNFYKNLPKEFILLDDDIASGATMNKMAQIFSDRTIHAKSLLNEYKPFGNRNIYDIVDARDFDATAKFGGILLDDESRKPYCHPQVDLTLRMKLSERQAIDFTNIQYEINQSTTRAVRSAQEYQAQRLALASLPRANFENIYNYEIRK